MESNFFTNSIKNRRDEVWELIYRQTHRTKNIKQKVFNQTRKIEQVKQVDSIWNQVWDQILELL